ncbi:branched-chain amino acid transport system II carrier protein [Holdemanella biformis]|uniref:branched-chain amino acid transport system II carrier protein n=1 Tax=Holdemanella biformis TaxID=1735 RepID=UPI003AF341D5
MKQKEYDGYQFYVVLTVLWSWKFNLSTILRIKCRGTYVYCDAGFLLTAVVLPVLGVIVVARFDGLDKLSGKAGKRFAFIFTVLIYLSIGPGLGIPRAASVPFEMAVSPYLPNDANRTLWMVLYSALFFLVALWLCLNPGKLVQRIGRVLTPSLLILLVLLFISFVTKGNVNVAPALDSYQSSAFLKGFTEGYNTMNTIAALNFGLVISTTLVSFGLNERKDRITHTVYAGIFAGSILAIVYMMLSYMGMCSSGVYAVQENGAWTLRCIVQQVFGDGGAILLAAIFTLACLTTCVGLINSISQFFSILFKNFVEIYLESMEHRIKENTLMTKQNIFYHHIVPYLGEMKFWTKEEYLTFSRAMMNKEESYHAFEILYWCGIRLGELLALTAEDFDFEKKTLRINKSYQQIKGKDVITTPKTRKSNRVLTLPDFLVDEMQDYISRLPYLKVDDRIFTITKSGLHHEMDRGCRETGVKRIRVHDLRHSHVSMLIEMGFSAVDIANRVGHESVKVTYRYAHMFPNKDLMIAKKLNISRNGEKDEQKEPGSKWET